MSNAVMNLIIVIVFCIIQYGMLALIAYFIYKKFIKKK